MFHLEKEIDAWCGSIHTSWFNRKARIEELKDHLYCEIEHLQTEGLSEKQAFFIATKRLENVEELMIEHSKNRPFISTFYHQTCDNIIHNLEKWRVFMSPKKAASLIIVVSIIFAMAITFSTSVLDGTPYNQTVRYLLLALWFIPFSLLSIAGTVEEGSVKAEYLCIKRKVTSLLNRG